MKNGTHYVTYDSHISQPAYTHKDIEYGYIKGANQKKI